MNLNTPVILGFILLFTTFKPTLASNNTFYISSSGSGNTCSNSSPCTFTSAQSLSQSGDIIQIEGSIGSIIITKPGITIRGGKVDGSDDTNNDSAAILIKADNTTLENIEITNGWEYGFRTADNINNTTATGLNIHHNVRENFSGNGCKLSRSSGWGSAMRAYFAKGLTLTDSQIWENCGEGFSAVMSSDIHGSNLTLRDNFSVEVYPDQTSNYSLTNSSITCQNPAFQRNLANTSIVLGAESGYGTITTLTKDITIQNNQITNCKGINYYKTTSGDYSNIVINNNNFSNLVGTLINPIPGSNVITTPNTINSPLPSQSPSPSPIAGDFNNDSLVNALDYVRIHAGYGSIYSSTDYNALLANYGN